MNARPAPPTVPPPRFRRGPVIAGIAVAIALVLGGWGLWRVLAGSAGDFILPADQPVAGAHLSVWCDSPDSMTEEAVATHLQEWLQVFAQQTWGSPDPTATLAELEAAVLSRIGTAPEPD